MIRINEAFIDKLPAATADMKPKPFPGRYPTRVWISFSYKDVYLGKPTVQMCNKLARLVYPEFMALEMVEFDRGAKFFGFTQGGVVGCNEYLQLYHPGMPFTFGAAGRMSWFGMPFRTLRVGKHSFYTTQAPPNDMHLKQYISQRLSPQLIKPVVVKLKPTRPQPRSDEYESVLKYRIARDAWRKENAAYIKQRDAERLEKFQF